MKVALNNSFSNPFVFAVFSITFDHPILLTAFPLLLLLLLLSFRRKEAVKVDILPSAILLQKEISTIHQRFRREATLLFLCRAAALSGIILLLAGPVLHLSRQEERFVLPQTDTPCRVLLVDGNREHNPLSAADYIEAALNQRPQPASDTAIIPFFQVEKVNPLDFSLFSLSRKAMYDTIILSELAMPTVQETNDLKRIFQMPDRRTQTICLIFGPNTDVTAWNENFFLPLGGKYRLESKVDLTSRPDYPVHRPIIANSHPVTDPLIHFRQSGLENIPVRQYYPVKGIEWKSLLRNRYDNQPVLVELSLSEEKSGPVDISCRTFAFLTGPNPAMSGLATSPAFLPLIQNCVGRTELPVQNPVKKNVALQLPVFAIVLAVLLAEMVLRRGGKSQISDREAERKFP